MPNLNYVSAETKTKIEKVLSSYSTHQIVKDVIKAGLEKDCVDVCYDVQTALSLLQWVRDEILGGAK